MMGRDIPRGSTCGSLIVEASPGMIDVATVAGPIRNWAPPIQWSTADVVKTRAAIGSGRPEKKGFGPSFPFGDVEVPFRLSGAIGEAASRPE